VKSPIDTVIRNFAKKKVSKAALFVDNYKYLIIVLYNYAPAQGALSDDAV